MTTIPPSQIASQLDATFNDAVASHLGERMQIIEKGIPASLPAGTRVLVAAPWIASGDREALRASQAPAGWPFGLQWIQLLTSGIDMYPDWFLRAVPVTTARGSAANAIAEYALAAILCAVRDMPAIWIHGSSQWKPRSSPALSGSRVAVLGYGPIGRAVALKCAALGCHVRVLRQSGRAPDEAGIELARDARELIADADHLVLAAPATGDTLGFVNADLLAAAKPGLHVVNVGRGELVDDEALLAALESGKVARATLDVTTPEPLPDGHAYYAHPRVFVSPHIAAISPQSRVELARKFVENLHRFEAGEPLVDQVRFGGPDSSSSDRSTPGAKCRST